MKNYFKKFSIFSLSLLLVFGLVGCDNEPKEKTCDPGYVLNAKEVCVLDEEEDVPDTTDPVISGAVNINYVMEDPVPDYTTGVTASDDTDGDLTSNITIDSSAVDLTTAGTYVVTFTVSDAAGNSDTVTIDVIVSEKVLTNEELAKLDLAEIDLSGEELSLPRFGANGTFFYWETSNPRYVSANGFIINPPVGSDPVDVVLSVTAVNGSYMEDMTFPFTIQPNPEVVIATSESFEFEAIDGEWTVAPDDDVELFFEENGNIPYIDIETFVDMLNGVIDSDELVYTPIDDDKLEVSYDVEWEDFDGSIINETYSVLFDFTENTVTTDDVSFFGNYQVETESDYGEGLEYVDAYYKEGSTVVYDLGAYNFDIVIYEVDGVKNYLLPFSIANFLFAGDLYYHAYYNGDKIWGIDFMTVYSSDEADEANVGLTKVSSLNGTEMPDDIKLATYHFLAFAFDHFFGRREEFGVETYYDIFSYSAESIIDGSTNFIINKMFDIAYGLDDMHTSFQFMGPYASDPYGTKGVSISDVGPNTKAFYEKFWALGDALAIKYGGEENIPSRTAVRIIDDGKTAVVFMPEIDIDVPDEFKAILDALPAGVENVVLDLTYNLGGNSGAAMRVFGYITEETLESHYYNPLDGSAVTYFVESSYVAYTQYNWYVLSSNSSYSAANKMVSQAKEFGIPVLGQKSGGGASSVGLIVFPDGTGIATSSNNLISIRTGNDVDGWVYESIEHGVEVDYFMSDVTSDTELLQVIAQHQADTAQ